MAYESIHQPIQNHKLTVGNTEASSEMIGNLANLPVDIVVEGETGTGKDTLAAAIHASSGREGRFIAVNCAALPETIAESELFGVQVGAYTGASNSRAGLIEASHNGTLYLDEIDSMPLTLQAKLLRVLEERAVMRLGSTELKYLDLRVISSTKKPLAQLVSEGAFRADLMYRLSAINLLLPSLRKNRTEILPLFTKFMIEFAKRIQTTPPELDTSLISKLERYPWPGNIRELKLIAERYVIGLPTFEEQESMPITSLKQRLIEHEIGIIKESIELNSGELELVANELGLPKRTLYYKLNKHNILNEYKTVKRIDQHLN
ncbi:putative Pathogenicity locus regulatory protein wtsA [Vibrio nigripulchritudo SO65]|uniref:sigma 54-interacting transcriptional regulator n=1 Tax=Vibrio nigripulchritudo TaxID=28173 RepID=UPI0003B1F9FD|nr:sigma 54-interacting transcriptional regulator [Vibrio nigripulchritudo]CCN38722.1 putative Pathogenicity locus regulatory protein wtsA [Vibrio nigripulchritudo AM115]CCN45029.1 putative Pathogenicity locus regulatory protein wtsA [Vibrio nigripulchritudo FTn2]CCN79788.1 putative Pathogenicity locus regulatory protein wtsA [Vibrio nigripulchritudo SO65]CCO44047.1 putative Pathogenicity locus regulatory protein wtsA [Vibrio nigripulchritudo SFn135]